MDVVIWASVVSMTIFAPAFASNGDRSFIFSKCLQRCRHVNCTNAELFSLEQPTHMKFLLWSCEDECKYLCMWKTVEAYRQDGSKVPQFYGKWPFVRYGGIQEPASMVFSLMNALCHLSIFVYRSKVPSSSSMYYVWHGMAVVGMMTWSCATIFHTKDTRLTERLDYFSAFALVLYNIFTLLCRVIGTDKTFPILAVASTLAILYCYHIHYLHFVHFDYGYNMLVNIVAGVVNAIGWIAWCSYHGKSRPYVWKCITVLLGLLALLSLELGDFPPLMWTYDAHALWHAGTVPMTLLWYSFIIDDALHETKTDRDDVKKMV